MTHADFEVVRIVRGGDLDRAGAKFGVYVFVGDDDELTVQEGMRQAAADQPAVTRVVGMHRDRGIAEHRLDPGGGHHDVRLGIV